MQLKRTRRVAKKKAGSNHDRKWGGGDVYAALADPTRRRIIDLLSTGDQPVHELTESFSISRPAVSQHLRVLREAGLVMERRVGRERRYRLQAAALREVSEWLAQYERFWNDRLAQLGNALDTMEDGE